MKDHDVCNLPSSGSENSCTKYTYMQIESTYENKIQKWKNIGVYKLMADNKRNKQTNK